MARVLALLAQGFEEIEAVTVVDVLRRAGVEVTTASVSGREVRGARGMTIVADAAFQAVAGETFDLIYLPGGLEGMERLAADPGVGDCLRQHVRRGGRLAAICAATFALHAHGLIPRAARITSHPVVADELQGYRYVEDRVVVDGHLITSRGPGTAMELALELVAELAGSPARHDLEAAMLVPAAARDRS